MIIINKIISFFSDKILFEEKVNIEKLKDYVLNLILLIVTIVATPLVFMGMIEAYNLQQYKTAILYLVVFIPVPIAYIFRKNIPYLLKSIFIVLPSFILGISNIFIYSFNGAGIPILLTTIVVTTIFLNMKYSIIILGSSLLSMIAIGFLFIQEKIFLDIGLYEISTKPISWVTASATLLLLGLIIIFCTHIIQKNLLHSNNLLLEHDKILEAEIIERIKAEHRIREDLLERESLVNELYHRTKNNMQVVISLMRMEIIKSKTGGDVLIGLINKIESMALVHQMLYKSKDFSSIKLKEYLTDLPGLILQNYDINNEEIIFNTAIDDITISIETAVPLGMVFSELIVNTIKHSYHKDDKSDIKTKEITIEITQHERVLKIHYRDNGRGIDPSIDLRKTSSMGLQTVFGLIEHQLLGEISYDGSDGLNWYITINLKS